MGNIECTPRNYPEKDGVKCLNCDIDLPPNNVKFYQINSEILVFYSTHEKITSTDEHGIKLSGQSGSGESKGKISHTEKKKKVNLVSFLKVEESDTIKEDHSTLKGYICLKCFFKNAKEKDLNRFAQVLRNFDVELKPSNCKLKDLAY